jgi:hypothetical protein
VDETSRTINSSLKNNIPTYDVGNQNFQIEVPLMTTKGHRLIIHEGRKYNIKKALQSEDNTESIQEVQAFVKCANSFCSFIGKCKILSNCKANECVEFEETSGNGHAVGCIGDEHAIINEKARQQVIYTDADANSYRVLNASLRDPAFTSESYVASQAFTHMKPWNSLQSAISNKRQKTEHAMKQTDVKSIIIPIDSKYRLDNFAKPFLIANEPHNRGSILIFGTDKFLSALYSAKIVLMDGTFKSVPSIFKNIKGQLLCFHIVLHEVLYTLLYCLLPDKSTSTYSRVLNILRNDSAQKGLPILWEKVSYSSCIT